MRITSAAGALALLGLAACSASPEFSNPMETGVGFGDYQRYLAERDSVRRASATPYSVPPEPTRGAILPPPDMPPAPGTLAAVPLRYVAAAPPPPPQVAPRPAAVVVSQPPAPAASITAQVLPTAPSQPLAAPLRQTAPAPVPPQPAVQTASARPSAAPVAGASPGAPRPVQAGAAFGTTPQSDAGPSLRPRISDEQDFDAVSARESIESDRERLEQQRAQYQVIEVASVPDDSVTGGPNIVAYALSTSHPPGTEMYDRANPLRWSRWEDACLRFRNQDAAQEAFLSNGGPERDRGNLDPDGDGYACWWDPTALRNAVASN